MTFHSFPQRIYNTQNTNFSPGFNNAPHSSQYWCKKNVFKFKFRITCNWDTPLFYSKSTPHPKLSLNFWIALMSRVTEVWRMMCAISVLIILIKLRIQPNLGQCCSCKQQSRGSEKSLDIIQHKMFPISWYSVLIVMEIQATNYATTCVMLNHSMLDLRWGSFYFEPWCFKIGMEASVAAALLKSWQTTMCRGFMNVLKFYLLCFFKELLELRLKWKYTHWQMNRTSSTPIQSLVSPPKKVLHLSIYYLYIQT